VIAGLGAALCTLALEACWIGINGHRLFPHSHLAGDLILAIQNGWWQGSTGGFTHLYSGNGHALVDLPGFQILLILVERVGSAFGLGPPTIQWSGSLLSPTSTEVPTGGIWYLMMPVVSLVAFTALLPLDVLCRRCGLSGGRRIGALLFMALSVLLLTARWGHPEYALAVGFVALAIVRAADKQWGQVGWLLGFGIACQLFLSLALVLFLVLAGRRWKEVALRVWIPGAAAVAIPLIGDFSATVHSIVLRVVPDSGHLTPWSLVVAHPQRFTVSPGLPRFLCIAASVALAFPLARLVRDRVSTRSELLMLVWSVAAVLALRGLFETKLYSYYLAPPWILVTVIVFGSSIWRIWTLVAGRVFFLVAFLQSMPGLWGFWSLSLLATAVPLVVGYPFRAPAVAFDTLWDTGYGTAGSERYAVMTRSPGRPVAESPPEGIVTWAGTPAANHAAPVARPEASPETNFRRPALPPRG